MRASLALWGVVFAGLQLDGARHPDSESQQLIRFQAPPTLSFQDLIDLAADPPPPAAKAKLDRLLSEPFISKEATLGGAVPKRPSVSKAGPVLRIAEWNINRGVNGGEIASALLGGARLFQNVGSARIANRPLDTGLSTFRGLLYAEGTPRADGLPSGPHRRNNQSHGFFVKPVRSDSRSVTDDLLFAPYFGRTLREVDEAVPGRISDHYAITVDLPLTTAATATLPLATSPVASTHRAACCRPEGQ